MKANKDVLLRAKQNILDNPQLLDLHVYFEETEVGLTRDIAAWIVTQEDYNGNARIAYNSTTETPEWFADMDMICLAGAHVFPTLDWKDWHGNADKPSGCSDAYKALMGLCIPKFWSAVDNARYHKLTTNEERAQFAADLIDAFILLHDSE